MSDGWHEKNGRWFVQSGTRAAAVRYDRATRRVDVTVWGIEAVSMYGTPMTSVTMPCATPRQVLDAMIRADRMIAGEPRE